MDLSFEGIVGLLFRPLLFAFYFLSGFAPRRPDRWVFGSWSGKRFADNSAALFEYVTAHKSDTVEAIWISSNATILSKLRRCGYRAYHPWSLSGAHACLTAGVYVFDGLTKDINHWYSRGARRVLLRHGVGMKKVERAIEQPGHRLYQLFHGNLPQRAFWSYLLPWHLVRPDMLIATSPVHAAQGQEYYDVGPERMAITGFPRIDRLMRSDAQSPDEQVRSVLENAIRRKAPVYLYLPTFRDVPAGFEFPLEDMRAMANRLGIVLLVKLHYVDRERYQSFEFDPDSSLQLIDARIDPNLLFHAVDGLISDYSSVTFDFILTGKPVLFYVPDLEDYLLNSRTLYFNFNEITPGPRAKNVTELEAALSTVIDNRLGEWRDQYQAVLDRFHTFRDAESSKRTYEEILARFVP